MVWIETPKGKAMPCDPAPITARGEANETIVLDNGVVVRRPQSGMVGYVPHWATCPKAKAFK